MATEKTVSKRKLSRTERSLFGFGLLFILVALVWNIYQVIQMRGTQYQLTIIHTNDVHSRVEPFDKYGSTCTEEKNREGKCFGGTARLATAVKRVREQEKNLLFLDAGDQFQGSLFYTHYKGKAAATLMNELGYDAMAVGNHEFDDGPDTLARFIRDVNFPVLSANIDASRHPNLSGLVKPYVIVERAGEKIGLIGYTTETTANLSKPGEKVRFATIEEAIQPVVKELEAQGVNKIIALSHTGFLRDRQVAKKVEGIDVIISGHTNTFLSNTDPSAEGPYPVVEKSPRKEPVLVVSAYAYGKYLGRLSLIFNKYGVASGWQGEPELMDAAVAEDPAIKAAVTELGKPVLEIKNRKVGASTVNLDGDRSICRFQECNLGNLITDAMLEASQGTGTQIALQNGGGIRAGIPAGNVTMGQVLEVHPFGNTLATFKIKGADLMDALENAVSSAHDVNDDGSGRFMQMSGMRLEWDVSKPAGSRVVRAEVRQADGRYAPVDSAATYGVVTTEFIRKGGDGFTVFKEKAIDPYDYGPNLETVIADHFRKHSPVSPKVEGRIKRTDSPSRP